MCKLNEPHCRRRHLLDDSGHVTKYGGVKQRRDDHHADAEDLLVVRRACDIAETDS
jgi:hypothetical protein